MKTLLWFASKYYWFYVLTSKCLCELYNFDTMLANVFVVFLFKLYCLINLYVWVNDRFLVLVWLFLLCDLFLVLHDSISSAYTIVGAL